MNGWDVIDIYADGGGHHGTITRQDLDRKLRVKEAALSLWTIFQLGREQKRLISQGNLDSPNY